MLYYVTVLYLETIKYIPGFVMLDLPKNLTHSPIVIYTRALSMLIIIAPLIDLCITMSI